MNDVLIVNCIVASLATTVTVTVTVTVTATVTEISVGSHVGTTTVY